MHLSCSKTNTVFKRTKARFHMTHVIYEFHQVCPNWFLSIWYFSCKLYTYLASRLALSPNRPNRAFTWASSPMSTIRCVQNGFLAYGALGENRATILHWNSHSPNRPNEIPYDTRHLGVPTGASNLISEHMVCPVQTVHLSFIKISTISK